MLWKRKKEEALGQAAPSLFTTLLVRCNQNLLRWAMYLQRLSISLPPRKLKWLLAVFCLFFVSSSSYVILTSLKEKRPLFRITPIQAVPLEEKASRQSIVTSPELLRIHQLRLSLDSLAQTKTGKVQLDSLLRKHPKLLDTLVLLESIYSEQHKN